MEKLDVVFASRYLDAYFAYQNKTSVSKSWVIAFNKGAKYWPIVLQYLLIGINAHINLDLGIAAAEISKGKNLGVLKVILIKSMTFFQVWWQMWKKNCQKFGLH